MRQRNGERLRDEPRNLKAIEVAREQGEPILVSFMGTAPFSGPAIYCDPGRRYEWGRLAGLLPVVVVDGRTNTADALPALLDLTNTIATGYPLLVDVQSQMVACVVHGSPVSLWQYKRDSTTWRELFR